MYLIDGEALSNAFDEEGADICTEYGNWGFSYQLVHDLIARAPEVDAVVVVRCKDCKYHRELNSSEKEYYNENALICTNSYFLESTAVESNDFCRYGKRREVNV